MWSQIVLCALVALAAASSSNPGWKDNTEYVYQIRGRTLASLHEVADEYSGILLKAKLIVRPTAEGKLMAKIDNAEYAQVHSHLSEGWNTYIPDSQLSYKQLPTTDKPFQIVMEKGVVRDLIVDQDVPEWEANIIKSIVSQMQLDTKGENRIHSQINTFPTEQSNNGVYKTLEDTVTGITETLYEIKPLPEYVLQSKPWLAPFPHLKGDGHIIEIVKNKNFSNSEERPTYYFGLSGMGQEEPATNQLGQILTRTSMGHAIITGNLNRYTIQHSMTVNKIIVSPTLNNQQKGSVMSALNITLANAQPQSSQFEELAKPVSLGSLVYSYSKQSGDNKVKAGRHFRAEEYNTEDSREQRFNSPSQGRFRRHSNEQFSSDVSSEEQWQQEQPKLNEAPEIPMLRFSTGFQGKSIKHHEEGKARKAVQKLANEIAQELEHFEQVPKKSTLAKFVLISSLTRIMNEQELQEIARELYTKEQHGVKRAAWVAFRDAVAESGTGPALLTIKQWIESQKVQHEEAAQIFETMVSSVRQPTEEYIKTLYHLIKSNEVLNQQHLNETALLSFSELVRKVYVDEQVSHNEYPVHTFGNFRTESGVTFVRQEYIPFLAGHLRKSIEQADNRKIHVYIRALGNVAHEDILSVFEPYLEGKKQVSQFQRLLMVVALDEFSKVEPKLARAVLYKIYQNIGETQEVRSAAVFQLMRTSPPTDMLQRMAEYTHQDPSQHVRSAVKSVIESASQLEGYEFQYLRKSAESARPLLTKKDYGVQYPKDYLRSYVAQEMKVVYKQTIQSLVGEESALPNALKYSLRAKIGGLNRYLVNAQAMVSSIDELVNVLYRQTESYKHQQQQQQQQQEQSEKSQWSSKYVAQLLNMHVEEREQLEGNLYLHLGNLHRILSFDNRSIELAPEMIREVEQMLQGEKSFRYTKLANNGELVISFPTEMGFPFMYTYDMPALVRIEGKVVATAKPQLVSGDKIRMPEQIDAQTELKVFVSARMQTKLGFITPFDHQEYAAGYDKNVQFQIPIRSKVNIDLKQKEVRAEIEALEPERNTPLVHYSSWPYTATYDILSMEPIANRPTTKVISKKTQHKMDRVFGQQSTGVAFRVRYSTEQRFVDVAALVEKLRQRDPITALMTPWLEESIQRADFDIEYQGEQSTTRKLKIKLSGEHEYQSEPREESNESIEDLVKLPKESAARKQELLKKSSAGIRDVKSFVYDAEIKFEGEQPSEYVATTAVSKSDVDRKSRVLFYLNKKSEGSEQKPFHMALSIKSWVPNTNGLNMQEAIEMDSSVKSEIKMAFGQQMESATKVHANLNIKKTDARKQYLSELPMYHQCRREMEQGNYQLPACANMTQMANILDRVQMEIKYENVHQQTRDVAHKVLNGLRALGYFNLKEDLTKGHGKENHIDFEAQFSPDLRGLDISFETKAQKVQWDNIRVNDWMQRVIAVHPVFHVRARLAGKMLGLTTFRPICVVDKTAANTFDNKTYPLELTNIWTVMLQYVPRHARQHQQEHLAEKTQKYQQDKYVVLVRQSKSEQKEVKIILAVPETKGQTVEITLKPAEGQATPSVFVDEQQVQIHEDRVYKIHQGLVQIYGLPKGEVKVEVRRGFYVIFDGKRVKLTVTENKFRNSVRGLCGTFDGESNTDFTTPRDCVLRDPREFMATYSLIAPGHENQEIMDLKSRAQKNHCVYRKVPLYVELISQRDQTEDRHNKRCSIHQTRYVNEDGQICFTLRPLPACRQECQQRGTISKNVEVHCVQKSNVAELWMNQIQKGASPDFSLKSATKTIKMELPQTCTQ